MALQLDTIRATADRVAASHGLEVVDLEFSGGARHRTLRVFVEKDAAGRARLAELAAREDLPPEEALPKGVPVELLSGTTHEDCAAFATDFGTLLDVEDTVPGDTEYTLEVSSPGIERKLLKPADYQRFLGSLVKLQTFMPIDTYSHLTGRMTAFADNILTLDLSAVKAKGKGKKAAPLSQTLQVHISNIEKANLVAEI